MQDMGAKCQIVFLTHIVLLNLSEKAVFPNVECVRRRNTANTLHLKKMLMLFSTLVSQ